MKNIILTIVFIISSTLLIQAQNNLLKPNEILVSYKVENEIVMLSWETNREVNSSYFLIEKSYDGVNFETLGTQKAGSSTYKTTEYNYEDLEYTNTGIYRVTLITMNGNAFASIATLADSENIAIAIVK